MSMDKPAATSNSPWDSVAREYEVRVEPFTRLFVEGMLSRFDGSVGGVATTKNLLDVGCGTGALALSAAADGFHVTACDASDSMVTRLQERVTETSQQESIHAFVADGQKLPDHLSNQFDYAASCFAVIFFPDPVLGLREICRCLKPKIGRIVISAWGNAQETAAFQIFPEAMRMVVPERAEQGKPKRIVGSRETLTNLMEQAGFVDIVVLGPITHILCVESAQEYYNRFALTSPPLQRTLSELPEQQRESLKTKVMELATQQSHCKDGSIRLPSSAYLAYGRKP